MEFWEIAKTRQCRAELCSLPKTAAHCNRKSPTHAGLSRRTNGPKSAGLRAAKDGGRR